MAQSALCWTCPSPERLEVRAMMTASPEADFSFEDGVITSYSGPGGEVVIPATIGGQAVTAIDWYAFNHNIEITGVVIPEGVTSIGSYAFSGCISLTSIVIPEGVTSIGDNAFSYCSSLASIALPSTLTTIEDNPFADCDSLSDLNIAAGNTSFVVEGGVLYDAEKTSVIAALPAVVTAVVIPEGVANIGSGAFSGCSSLTSITLPSTLTSISDSAFSRCRSLASIVIPEGVTSIGYRAFSDCSSLTSIVIPEGVTSIGSYAFSGCISLTSIVIPEGVTSIGDNAFSYCSSLASIVIPQSVTWIGSDAFYDCRSLQAVVFLNDFIGLPGFSSVHSGFRVYFDKSRQGWVDGASSRPDLDIRPLDAELGGIPLSVNGDNELVLGLDSAMRVRDSISGGITAITKNGASVTTVLWGRWAIGEAAEFSGNQMLFARDISTGRTHRIYVTVNWEVGGVFDSVANNFSEYLPRSARGNAVESGVVEPSFPPDIRIPIDLGGNAKLHRSFSGQLFVNRNSLFSATQNDSVLINSEPGFRAIAAESLETNQLLFQSVDGAVLVWEFDVDWDQGARKDDAVIEGVAGELRFLIDINRDRHVGNPPGSPTPGTPKT